jgi:hypothetical protein
MEPPLHYPAFDRGRAFPHCKKPLSGLEDLWADLVTSPESDRQTKFFCGIVWYHRQAPVAERPVALPPVIFDPMGECYGGIQ